MLSIIVLTKNEEKNIIDCLISASFADELLVIDDNSSDKTVAIAKKHKARVFRRALDGNFSMQRNFGLTNAKEDWVFFLDADERISKSLQDELLKTIKKNSNSGFFLKRQDIMWGKKIMHGEAGSIRLMRLGRKNAGKWEGDVHETWRIKEATGELKNPILHYPHQSVKSFLEKINMYTTLRAKELYQKGTKANFFTILLYPKAKFVYNYFIRLGFLDGTEGFIFAMLMSFHSFLVRGKLWLLWQKNK